MVTASSTGGLWQRPRLMLCWKSGDPLDERKISWAELFIDLVFVTTIAKMGEALRAVPTDEEGFLSVPHYLLYFGLLWFTWTRLTSYATRFHNDDLSHKILFFVFMVACVGIAMHLAGGPSGMCAHGAPNHRAVCCA